MVQYLKNMMLGLPNHFHISMVFKISVFEIPNCTSNIEQKKYNRFVIVLQYYELKKYV